MKLNFAERFFIVSGIRKVLMHKLEAPRLFAVPKPVSNGRVLEIGCGPGRGLEVICDRLGADTVDAFDLDPRMVHLARTQPCLERGHAWVGNVRHIPVPNDTYDAVVNFGVLHHVVDWRSGLAEIHRVLKPGGRFYSEEILERWITHPVLRHLMEHPQHDRFDGEALIEAMQVQGFSVERASQMADLYHWAVAEKEAPPRLGEKE